MVCQFQHFYYFTGFPLVENAIMTFRKPKAQIAMAASWMQNDAGPVEQSVPATLRAILPALPMPVVMIFLYN